MLYEYLQHNELYYALIQLLNVRSVAEADYKILDGGCQSFLLIRKCLCNIRKC